MIKKLKSKRHEKVCLKKIRVEDYKNCLAAAQFKNKIIYLYKNKIMKNS